MPHQYNFFQRVILKITKTFKSKVLVKPLESFLKGLVVSKNRTLGRSMQAAKLRELL